MERGLYFRLFDADHVIVLIATIGMSMVLKDGATKVWGSETRVFPVLFAGTWHVGDLVIRTHFVFIIGAAVVLIGIFHVLVGYTRMGLALRAVAENRRVAAMMGVRVVRMLAIAFGISYLLGAAAGALIGPIHYIATTGGTTMMIKGVAAAVLGGFGSLPGALVGGLAIGLLEALAAGFVSSAFKDVIVFARVHRGAVPPAGGTAGGASAGRVGAVTDPGGGAAETGSDPRGVRGRLAARPSIGVCGLAVAGPALIGYEDYLLFNANVAMVYLAPRHRLQHPPRNVRAARHVPRRVLRDRRVRLRPGHPRCGPALPGGPGPGAPPADGLRVGHGARRRAVRRPVPRDDHLRVPLDGPDGVHQLDGA